MEKDAGGTIFVCVVVGIEWSGTEINFSSPFIVSEVLKKDNICCKHE